MSPATRHGKLQPGATGGACLSRHVTRGQPVVPPFIGWRAMILQVLLLLTPASRINNLDTTEHISTVHDIIHVDIQDAFHQTPTTIGRDNADELANIEYLQHPHLSSTWTCGWTRYLLRDLRNTQT
jgi:hypothetical protein